MRRAFLILATLGLFTTALVGCRAEGELDVDTASPFTVGR
jgi:hypothetical protein